MFFFQIVLVILGPVHFQMYKSFTLLFKFIPRYFNFWCNFQWNTFLISFFKSQLFVYRNEADFYILILHPAALLNMLISSHMFLVGSLRFCVCNSMSSAKYGCASSFLTCILSTSFSCLIVLARTFSAVLNKSGSRQPCLIPYVGGRFSFSLLSEVLAVSLHLAAFTVLRYILFVPTLLGVLCLPSYWT